MSAADEIQGNQQNGNGVAPQVDGNLLYALLSEQQRTNDEQRRTNDEQRRTNDEQRRTNNRYDERFQAMQLANNAQMIEQRRTNDEQRRINDRNDERFQAMQRANNALETGISKLDTRQNTLETDQAASRNHISGLQARLDALEARLQTVETMARDRGQNQAAVDATKSKQREKAEEAVKNGETRRA